MLDLSYPDIRTALIEAGKQPSVTLTQIQPITDIDLAAARRIDVPQIAENKAAAESRTVSLAILPHAPFTSMAFDPQSDAVQVSTALRHRFAQLPAFRVASPVDVQRQLRRLQSEGLSDDQAVRGIGARLGVDYVVWGKVESNTPRVETAAYRRSDGARIVQVSFDGERSRLANVLLTTASTADNAQDDAFTALSHRLRSVAMKEAFDQPIANDAASTREILAALEALDQSLALAVGDESSVELLNQADASCRAAIASDPRNALAHWLSSNVAYNQAARLFKVGDTAAAESRIREMKSALRRAFSRAT